MIADAHKALLAAQKPCAHLLKGSPAHCSVSACAQHSRLPASPNRRATPPSSQAIVQQCTRPLHPTAHAAALQPAGSTRHCRSACPCHGLSFIMPGKHFKCVILQEILTTSAMMKHQSCSLLLVAASPVWAPCAISAEREGSADPLQACAHMLHASASKRYPC